MVAFNKIWQIVKLLCFYLPVSCFGNHLAQTLWNPSWSWMIPWAELWLMHTSSTVTHQSSRIMARTRSMFCSVVAIHGYPNCSSSVTLVSPFMNMIIYLYTLCCGKALFPYCAGSLWWIYTLHTLSAHKNHITASRAVMLPLLQWHYNWPVKVKSISKSCMEFVLLPECKISSTTNTINFKINHCKNFLTHLCISHSLCANIKILYSLHLSRFMHRTIITCPHVHWRQNYIFLLPMELSPTAHTNIK